MILPVVPDRALTELGRTEGGPETLGLLVRDQYTRRLLLLRAVLDAVEAADPGVCSADARARLREDWGLLEEADRVEPPVRRGGWGYEDGSGIAGVSRTGPWTGAGAAPADARAPGGRAVADPASATYGQVAETASGGGPGVAPGPGAYADPDGPGVYADPDGPGVYADPDVESAASNGDSRVGPRSVAYRAVGAPVSEGGGDVGPVSTTGAGRALAGVTLSPVRTQLLHPFVGPWARHCLRGLGAAAGPRAGRDGRELSRDLAYFGALAAVLAARAGVSYAVRLRARDGVLTLPSLGALRTSASGDVPVDVVHRRGILTLRRRGEKNIVVRLQGGGFGAWSEAAAWAPAYALPGLLPGSDPVPLDDLDPYRTARGGPQHHELSGPVALDDAERKRWLQSWSGIASVLRPGGEHRVTEAVALLRCLVPLSAPPGSTAGGRTTGSCSGTRREAFGALLSSTPPTPMTFAATLVHELQHTKLAALSDMLTLHHAGPQARYFAPWRPDPRPYDGLLQGTYSHLALADFFQRTALVTTHPAHRDSAWAQHARYREQVGAVLPALVGSGDLTAQGRRFVDQMVAVYERLAEHPAPRGQTARAEAYIRAARALWTQRHVPGE
ncbi:HEXXH motif domain-containing protein [Streptomyces albiflavescens]|uniref:HEXXH motif domain-containing protein n=1 Tax=Streptomyces albiflavescens TaxID=1623582 RepID=A0A917Y981_9ACTN|nr:HEXXH motif-containing putative peptide modification protein [Streptomyces albiflavescens]GGN78053.1 HEXXH motif domain-containing protein [Streptomyces albiflavescens]